MRHATRANGTVAGTKNTKVDYRFATAKSFGVISWHKTRKAAETRARQIDAYTAELKRTGRTCDGSATWFLDEPTEICEVAVG